MNIFSEKITPTELASVPSSTPKTFISLRVSKFLSVILKIFIQFSKFQFQSLRVLNFSKFEILNSNFQSFKVSKFYFSFTFQFPEFKVSDFQSFRILGQTGGTLTSTTLFLGLCLQS